MKGVIFNIFEEFIDDHFGEGSFDELVVKSLGNENEVFVSPLTYPDEKFFVILGKAIESKKLDMDSTLKKFGRYMFIKLAKKYPIFVDPYDHPKDFIKTINDVIHVEVRKIFLDSEPPIFHFLEDSGNKMIIQYESKRRLFCLAEGLLMGMADYYNQPIEILRSDDSLEKGNTATFDVEFL